MALDWTLLPLGVLQDIALKLETFEDFIYFSEVCRMWNHVSSSIKHDWKPSRVIQVPWLLLPENNKENMDCVREICPRAIINLPDNSKETLDCAREICTLIENDPENPDCVRKICSLFKNYKDNPDCVFSVPENNKENQDCVRKIFNPAHGRCYQLSLPETIGAKCWGSAYGWVAMVYRDGKVQLFNPITKAQIHFPSIHFPFDDEDEEDEDEEDDDDEDEEEDDDDNDDDDEDDDDNDDEDGERKEKEGEEKIELKLCEDDHHLFLRTRVTRLVVLRVSQNDHDKFALMYFYGYKQGFFFVREGDQLWTKVDTKFKITDIVAVGDRAFALCDDGAIVQWNVMECHGLPSIEPTVYSPSADPSMFEELNEGIPGSYLVQSGADLLMVLRYKLEISNSEGTGYDLDLVYQTAGFDVFKLNKEKKWEKVEDLGDVALFVGENSSFAVKSAQNLRHNSIYFTDDEYEFWPTVTQLGGHDMGVFDIKSEEIVEFYEGDDIRSSYSPATFFIPQL